MTVTTSGGRRPGAALMMLLVVTLPSAAVHAEEVQVIGAGAVRAIVIELARVCETETGHTATLSLGTVGIVRQRMAAEPADVVIMTDVAVDESARRGTVVAGSRVDIARTGMGVGLREGAPRPDIKGRFAQASLDDKD
jgi:molybdate transport system substrate-binding protein